MEVCSWLRGTLIGCLLMLKGLGRGLLGRVVVMAKGLLDSVWIGWEVFKKLRYI